MAALNDKQRAFVREYPKDWHATKAAIRAGYSPKSAHVTSSRLLANAKIKAELDKVMIKAERRTEITLDSVLTRLNELAERCMAEGDEFNPSAANRSLELLGKHLGAFVEIRRHEFELADLSKLSDETLSQLDRELGDE